MHSLLKLKNHLSKYIMVYAVIAIIVGFFTGLHVNVKAHAQLFKTLNLVVIITMIYPMMISLEISRLKSASKSLKQVLIALSMGLIVAPLLAWVLILILRLFLPIPSTLAIGILLATVVPCSSMAIAYTGLSDGNIELATIVVAISFTLAIVTVPLWLKLFASSLHVSISAWLLVKTIIIVVVIPLILGILTHYYLVHKLGTKGYLELKPLFPLVSLLGMFVIIFLIFMEKSQLVYSRLSIVGITLIPIILYYILSLTFLTYFNKWLKIPYEDHMAIIFTSVGKNEGTAMAIALTAGMGLMAIAPAITPIVQIPFLVGYLKVSNRIKKLFNYTEN